MSWNFNHQKCSRLTLSHLISRKWRKVTLFLWFTWLGYAIGYYGTILAVTRVFDPEAGENIDAHGGTPGFDYKAIFISASAEIVGLVVVIQTVDSIGRIPSQVTAYICGGIFVFSLSMVANTANTTVLTILAFCARAFEMMGSCVTWVSTAEILSTEIRTTGHSAANAMGRTGAFISPYLVGTNNPIKSVGSIMLVIHIFTAFCACHLPESKGREIGHTDEIDDANDIADDSEETEGNEMTFRYDENQPQNDSSRGIV